MKALLVKKIFRNFTLTEHDKKKIISLTDYDMDLDRCEGIIDFMIELKLDKGSLIGFLCYQIPFAIKRYLY